MYGEKAWWQLHKNAASNIEQVLEAATPQSSNCTAPYHPSRKLSKLDEPDMGDTAGEVRTNPLSDVLLWTPSHSQAKAGQPARTYIQQLSADMRYSPEDLLEAMDDREGGGRKGQGYPCWWHDMMMMIY